jgi:hypothetical protein
MNNWKNGQNAPTTSTTADSRSINSPENQPVTLIDYIDQTEETALASFGIPPASCPDTPIDPSTGIPYTGRQVPVYTGAGAVADEFKTASFYACVDSDKTVAKVFIRGNALARVNPKTVTPTYIASRSGYFPKASIQVQGIGLLQGGDQ